MQDRNKSGVNEPLWICERFTNAVEMVAWRLERPQMTRRKEFGIVWKQTKETGAHQRKYVNRGRITYALRFLKGLIDHLARLDFVICC